MDHGNRPAEPLPGEQVREERVDARNRGRWKSDWRRLLRNQNHATGEGQPSIEGNCYGSFDDLDCHGFRQSHVKILAGVQAIEIVDVPADPEGLLLAIRILYLCTNSATLRLKFQAKSRTQGMGRWLKDGVHHATDRISDGCSLTCSSEGIVRT